MRVSPDVPSDVLNRVRCTIQRYRLIEKAENVLVGLSGGPDSVCLLHTLHLLSAELGFKLYAAHVNHLLRGEESDMDERYARMLCEEIGIPFYVQAYDIKKLSRDGKLSLEEAGREARYTYFNSLSDRLGAARIAVAHNRDDQAETVLMHIIRGTGLDGLRGMDYSRGRIIRPLLDVPRKDIEEYCSFYRLAPRTDSSNLENAYTRNKVRLDLFPMMNRLLDTDVASSILRLSEVVRDDGDYLNACTEELLERSLMAWDGGTAVINRLELEKVHPALAKRAVRKAVAMVKGDLKGLESKHVESVLRLVADSRTGAGIDLPGGVTAVRYYDTLKISRRAVDEPAGSFSVPVLIPGRTTVEAIGGSLEASFEKKTFHVEEYTRIRYNSFVQFFDFDGLKAGITVRNRLKGDVFKPLKSNGTKKLKEYFIDCKIPRDLRDKVPLVAVGNEIVWVVGYKISDKFKVTENTKTVLKMEFRYTKTSGQSSVSTWGLERFQRPEKH